MLVIEMTSHCTSIVKLLDIEIEEWFVNDVSNKTDLIPRSVGFAVTRIRLPPEIVKIEGLGVKICVRGPQ
jgi:hypothetical protein